MKWVYVVTEGETDQIVLQGLVAQWLGSTDFEFLAAQPPSSAYTEGLDTSLSRGWKGVLAWCEGTRRKLRFARDRVLRDADCLIIHIDADVSDEKDFRKPAYDGPDQPASCRCDWVRAHLISLFGESLPTNVVLCIPSRDMNAWVLCCLYPSVADEHMPIDCRPEPGTLLVQRLPHRLVRRRGSSLRPLPDRYRRCQHDIAAGWPNCASGDPPRCSEAARFEAEARRVLDSPGDK